MNISIRRVSKYASVIVEHDNGTIVDLGLLNAQERKDLCETLNDAVWQLTDD